MQVTSILEDAIQIQDSNGSIIQIPFENLHAGHELINLISKQAIFQLAYTLGMYQSRQKALVI